jgi:hypothetical protein
MNRNTNKTGLFQPAFCQLDFIQSQIMTQLVQKSRVNLVPKNLLIALGKIPKIFEKQNDLRRHRNISLVGKLRPREQTQRVNFNSVRLQTGIWLALKRHRQFLRALAQWLRQRRQRRLDFRKRQCL